MTLLDLLQNAWVIGTLTGLASGLAVFLVTRRIGRRDDDRVLQQKLDEANAEVMHALRALVAESVVPSLDVLKSVVRATARRHHIDAMFMAFPRDYIDELVKDIMDSAFLSGVAKLDHAKRLSELIREVNADEEAIDAALASESHQVHSPTSDARQVWSILLGLVSFVGSTILATKLSFSNILSGIVVLSGLVAVTVGVAAVVFVLVSNLSGKQRRMMEDEKNKAESQDRGT